MVVCSDYVTHVKANIIIYAYARPFILLQSILWKRCKFCKFLQHLAYFTFFACVDGLNLKIIGADIALDNEDMPVQILLQFCRYVSEAVTTLLLDNDNLLHKNRTRIKHCVGCAQISPAIIRAHAVKVSYCMS